MKQADFVQNHYRQMYDKLYSYALCSLYDVRLSEEAVQETFRIACAKIDDFYSSQGPARWLCATLKYVIRNMQLYCYCSIQDC